MPEKKIDMKREDRYRDGLLWIGKTYPSILCGRKENCAVPTNRELGYDHGVAKCFVHEAEWRGISRKISPAPSWVRPGKTRIFLAHADGCRSPSHGKIFGYFVLRRVEIIGPADPGFCSPDVYRRRTWTDSSPGPSEPAATAYDAISGQELREVQLQARGGESSKSTERTAPKKGLVLPSTDRYQLNATCEKFERTQLEGVQVVKKRFPQRKIYLKPKSPEVREGDERQEACWNGDKIVTHRFDGQKWVKTGEKCPELPSACEEGQVKWRLCWNGTIFPEEVCDGGEWVDTGLTCPDRVPFDPEPFSLHRSCSLRLRPGAVYLVDSLCAEIGDRFADAVSHLGLAERFCSATNDDQRWAAVLDGRKAFREIANEISGSWETETTIPRSLADQDKVRGELVLFETPVLLIRKPKAYFRSLQRIDGDDLLDQIAKGAGEPTCVRQS